jgi:hypothetical protein
MVAVSSTRAAMLSAQSAVPVIGEWTVDADDTTDSIIRGGQSRNPTSLIRVAAGKRDGSLAQKTC